MQSGISTIRALWGSGHAQPRAASATTGFAVGVGDNAGQVRQIVVDDD